MFKLEVIYFFYIESEQDHALRKTMITLMRLAARVGKKVTRISRSRLHLLVPRPPPPDPNRPNAGLTFQIPANGRRRRTTEPTP